MNDLERILAIFSPHIFCQRKKKINFQHARIFSIFNTRGGTKMTSLFQWSHSICDRIFWSRKTLKFSKVTYNVWFELKLWWLHFLYVLMFLYKNVSLYFYIKLFQVINYPLNYIVFCLNFHSIVTDFVSDYSNWDFREK